jgi:hypothetical protein
MDTSITTTSITTTSIVIDNEVIPINDDDIKNLNTYYVMIYMSIVEIEAFIIELLRVSNKKIKKSNIILPLLDKYEKALKELRDNSKFDDSLLDLFEAEKINEDPNCKCPYKYREYSREAIMGLELLPHDKQWNYLTVDPIMYCSVCTNQFTLQNILDIEEEKEKARCQIYGLHLASDMSSTNILNALPNDIAKTVVQYL